MSAQSVRRHFQEYDVALERLKSTVRSAGHVIPCKSGCDACCYDLPLVFDIEMSPLIDRIKKMPKDEQMRVQARVHGWLLSMKTAGIDPFSSNPDKAVLQAYHQAHIACPLLDRENHVCTVYEDRPLACRGHYIVNETPEACKRGIHEADISCLNVNEINLAFGESIHADRMDELPKGAVFTVTMGMLGTMLAALWKEVVKP